MKISTSKLLRCNEFIIHSLFKNKQNDHEGSVTKLTIWNFTKILFALFLFSMPIRSKCATETIPTGSFIINMGIVPQTVANGLKPYGLLYELLNTYKVPVKWAINPSKLKDGIDFTHNGIDYKGGTFIILASYRSAAVNARITFWQGQGVVGATSVSSFTTEIYTTFSAAPRWTMDQQNGSIAVDFFTNAGIPSTAYGGSSSSGWKLPSALGCCDDIFVMPHADPKWSTHANLYSWNLNCKGSIWLGCHAGSALEDMFNPAIPSQQTNFLSEKTGNASGAGPYFQNALLLWGAHSDGTPPYNYDYPNDPVMQFMGTVDAVSNGSERIYIPLAPGWRTTTKVGVYDPTHPDLYSPYVDPQHRGAIIAYGPAFGTTTRGNVMLEACHDIASSTGTANVAAQRAFFNFSFLTSNGASVTPSVSSIPGGILSSGVGTPLSWTVPLPALASNYTCSWTSSCGGTFSPNATSQNVTFTPPVVSGSSSCNISVEITDPCGRKSFGQVNSGPGDPPINIVCALGITKTITNPTCNGSTNGSIAMTISSGTAPYTWTWTRTSPTGGPTSGSGTTISALAAGTYNVTVTSATGCTESFTSLLTQPAVLTASRSITNVACFGVPTGAINLTAAGGTTPYSYNWGSGITTEDRSGLAAGNYSVTVTDSKGCTATTSAAVTQPSAALNPNGTKVDVSCYGAASGSITLAPTGGTSPYTYNWGGGITTQNRTGLVAGTYNVIVTDANGCTATQTFVIGQNNGLTLSVNTTNPSCISAPPTPNGTINLTVSGGAAPYTYDWADLAPTIDPEDRTGLAPGNYSVIVTDTAGCTGSISATLTGLSTTPNPPASINH